MSEPNKKYRYPPRLPLYKFFLKAESIRKNPIPFHRRYFNTYGDTFAVRLGWQKYLMLSRDKEVVRHILQKNHKNYYKSTIQTKYLSKYLGQGLLTSNGALWLKQRRLIQPAFHKEKIDGLITHMESTILDNLRSVSTDKPIDMFALMNGIAFKVVANSLFHLSASTSTLERLQEIIQQIQLFLVKEVRLPHKAWWFRITGQVAKHKLLAEESRAIIRAIIEARRKSSETHNDLLDMLMATTYEDTGQPMSTRQLIDEISILFVAGHETTANALTFTSYLLAAHSDVQDKVLSEIRSVGEVTTSPIRKNKATYLHQGGDR